MPPSWAAIYGVLIGPACGDCHDTADPSGGLGGLEDCALGHAALVGVASEQLPTMRRVEPGDPAASWLMQKLDGTQNAFDAECVAMNCGADMPLSRPLLDAAARDAIRAWIASGAANDCP